MANKKKTNKIQNEVINEKNKEVIAEVENIEEAPEVPEEIPVDATIEEAPEVPEEIPADVVIEEVKEPEPAKDIKIMEVAVSKLNVRNKPSMKSKVKTIIEKGTKITVIDEVLKEGFVEVIEPMTGFVMKEYLK